MSNQAWVTLATNDSYSLGALVLAHSLRRVGSAFPAVVLITPSVTEAMRERLRAVFAEVVIVDVLDSGDAAHLALLQRPELGITFTKIHCWNLTQYEKCVFLDADTLVIQNCDELFEREELSAAPDVGWPDCFNSGVFVYKPSAETFSNLITFASERGSFDGGDQGLLNSYFSDWAHGDIKKHLPFLYNVTSAAFYSYLPALKHFGQNLKIIHFIGAIKPWLQQFNWHSRTVEAPEHLRNFMQLWWDLFVADVHTQLDTTMDFTVRDRKYLAIPFIKSSKSIHSHISLRSHEYNMCSKQTPPESNVDEEGNIEEDPSPVLSQEVPVYREPVLHSAYYEPVLDQNSEFPWHRPENQISDYELNVPEIDMSQFHDPWDIYRGNIPPSIEQSAPTEKTLDDYQDMRKYAWDYMPPQNHHNEHSHTSEQPAFSNYQPVYHSNQTSQHVAHNYNHNEQTEILHHTPPSNYSEQLHSPPQHSEHFNDHSHQHHREFGYHDTQAHNQHNSSEQQRSISNYQEPHNYHEHHYNCVDRPQDDNRILNIPESESQSTNFVSSPNKSLDELEVSPKHKTKGGSTYWQSLFQNMTKNVYTVMMDHVVIKHQQITEAKVNEYDSDSDSDVYEDITPRHPYDGFYLRHRMTIDSHGHKICSHEIPLVPRSPTPNSSDEYEDALDTSFKEMDIDDKTVINEDIQTGVAGNLARVVPGAPLQREAVDELTRRQGWEAGNIDYMGADSFDNIWAKISQTLNQPSANQTEQPTESTPQQISEPVVVETKMDVAEAVTEQKSVLLTPDKEDSAPTTEEKQIEGASVESEVPKEVEIEVSEPLQSEVPKVVETEVAKPLESEVPKAVEAEVSKPLESEGPKVEELELSKPLESEVPKQEQSEVPKPAESEVSKAAESEVTKPVESEVPKSAEVVASEPAVTIPEKVSTPEDLEKVEVPVPVSEAAEVSSKTEEPVPIPAEIAAEVPATVDPVVPVETSSSSDEKEKPAQADIPIAALEALKVDESLTEAAVPAPVVEQPPVVEANAPSTSPAQLKPAVETPVEPVTPDKSATTPEVGSDSPPLIQTPSKDGAPVVPAAKSEERRKPAGKLQLQPPAVADPLPTPDSELEDAATLAHAIIASELRTPTVTAPTPPSYTPAPASTPASPLSRLSVQEPEVPSPPVDSVSLTQIGVKPKPSTAALIESSVTAKSEPSPKAPEATESPKKKVVKKVIKKEKEGAGTEAPVPPPRKKEKKPKEK